jgi:galactokinase
MVDRIKKGEFDNALAYLYADVPAQRLRYIKASETFYQLYGCKEITIVSAPGRSEIGGNHTDHQRGLALAAAVDLDVICVCAKTDDNIIRVRSDGFAPDTLDLRELSLRENEKGTSAGLIRGVAAWFGAHGYPIGGFNAYTASAVPGGSGLSSSAAFETAIAGALKSLYKSEISPTEIALAGQYAENVYFGKPSGLLDQIAASVGGLMMVDFISPQNPQITNISIDLTGYEVCITDTKGSHADLTPEYAAVTEEMNRIAQTFGKTALRDVEPEEFYQNICGLRKFGDRAVLRAMHFFEENERVKRQTEALQAGKLNDFFALVNESGRSSTALLQNIFPASEPQNQGLSLALALSKRILCGRGACRVHGGGFAGSIQAYVPASMKEDYKLSMEAVFGSGCCHFVKIRPTGGMEVITNG